MENAAMPRKKKRRSRARPVDETTLFVVRVDRYDVRAEAAINRYAHSPEYAWRDTEDEPLYEFETNLEIKGTGTYPESRVGDRCDLTVYGDLSPQSQIYWKLQDIQVVDEHYARKYRGKRIPVYDPPRGMGMFDKVRGEPGWRGAIWAQPRFISDLLVLLAGDRPLFMAITERKIERHRWIQRVSLQTNDPAEE
jgi:hypothetical protein